MDEQLQNVEQQHPDEPVTASPPSPDENQFTFTDEDIQFAQWALALGGYMQSLMSDPARAADEFESVAKSLREMASQPEQSQPEPRPAEQPVSQPKQEQPDINSLVQQAVEQAVSKMFEQMKKQALASPVGLAGRAVNSRRLADLIE